MTRVIVHAGFYKTGTTSLQKYLAQNRDALAPYFTYYGQNDFHGAGAAARIYGQKPFPWRRSAFRAAFRAFLNSIPDAPVIVMSRENFSGAMPGHRDWRGRMIRRIRPTAERLCRDIADELRRRFGRDVEIEFLFTTRDQDSWLRSVYGHLVRSIHLTERYEDFRAQFPRQINLADEARHITKALRPLPVHIVRLEDVANTHEGPATAVLDLLGIPADLREELPAARVANARQDPDLEAEMLELNRSGIDKDRLRFKKEQLLRGKRQ